MTFRPNALEIFLFLAFFFGIQILLLPFILFLNLSLTSPLEMLMYYVSTFGLPIVFYYLFVLKPKSKKYEWNWQFSSLKIYLMIFPILFSMIFISEFFISLIPTEGAFFGPMYKAINQSLESLIEKPFILLILTSLCAPILEEMLFRGILLRAMLNYNVKPYKAIVISSLVFGLIHANPWQFVGASLLGFVIGLVYWRTNSLSNAVLLHFTNNLIASLFTIYIGNESISDTFNWNWSYVLVLSVGVFIVSIRGFLKQKHTF